ncbi:MAG TPA: hypothetical protein VKA03_09905 [Methylovirgula sp.]|nr:hypothetical protein [Methylovirgula sp.]
MAGEPPNAKREARPLLESGAVEVLEQIVELAAFSGLFGNGARSSAPANFLLRQGNELLGAILGKQHHVRSLDVIRLLPLAGNLMRQNDLVENRGPMAAIGEFLFLAMIIRHFVPEKETPAFNQHRGAEDDLDELCPSCRRVQLIFVEHANQQEALQIAYHLVRPGQNIAATKRRFTRLPPGDRQTGKRDQG